MFGFGKRKNHSELEEKLNNIQVNLENNYKDEAHKAYREAKELFEEIVANGDLKDKQIELYTKKLCEFEERLKNYGHNLHVGW